MTNIKNDDEQRAQLIAEMRKAEQQRKVNYREQALRLFPHVCGRCSREFSGKKLSELTVHHRDHNHDNNPPDGSNWELLCLYCHDHEHTRGVQADRPADTRESTGPTLAHSPFAGLSERLKPTD
ncbi:MAG: HNH nuclease family protein [Deltaproteobacteria bacterium]|nr:HNH nuclease family protein [Deltaproteobacteria bacterium]